MLGFNKKTQDASPQENTGGENKVLHFIKTHKKRCIAVVVAVAVLAVVVIPRRSRSASADMAYVQEALGRRDIVNVYDGNGTINAADSYTVKSLVTGTVLTADFELGDSIEKGDVLYVIDSSDVEGDLESAQLSVSQAQRSYDDAADARNVRTKISGEVSSFAVAAGDAVQAGQTVATVRDTSVMLRCKPCRRRQPDDLHRHHRGAQHGQPDHRAGRSGAGERRQLPQLGPLCLPA